MSGFKEKYKDRCRKGMIALSFLVSAGIPLPAFSGTPLLIEMFGSSYKCAANKTVERQVEELLKQYPDAILLNCRLENAPTIPSKEMFGRSYCNTGRMTYFRDMGLFGMANPMVIVNGRYDANNAQVEAALKVALSLDRLESITIKAAPGGIDIAVPALPKGGALYLYTYASFEKEGAGDDEGQGKVNKFQAGLRIGDKVFNGERPFRPIVKRELVAHLKGGEVGITYPVKHEAFPDYGGANLGYVAVVHESGLSSPVVATGELLPSPEMLSGFGDVLPLPANAPAIRLDFSPAVPQTPPPPS